MRCAVHTLQLAIRDGLKEKDVDRLVSKFCHVDITARTPKIDAILKRKFKKVQSLTKQQDGVVPTL